MKKPCLLFILTGGLLIVGAWFYVAFFLSLSIPPIPSSILLLDRNGREMGELIHSGSMRHRKTNYEEIPDFYKRSLIALEDRTFWTNNGISFRGIVRSIVHDFQAGKMIEWGTTLSSWLIRNVFWINENRTIGKKILEFLYAVRLNRMYPKEAILSMYIDRVYFGHMNYGLVSAAKYYFDQEPQNLTKAEQLALLILPRDAGEYDPYAHPKKFRARFETVVQILVRQGVLSQQEQENILNEKLGWSARHTPPLPYVSDFLNTVATDGTRQDNRVLESDSASEPIIVTTFDRELSEKVNNIAKNTLSDLAWRNVSDYGILVVERSDSGSLSNPLLRVMIGGADYSESAAGQVNSTLSLRQPGSAIKPFTYLLAFGKLGLTPESTILDLPTAYKTSENYAYEPKNYSQDYKGEITLRQALSESINIPAVKLAERVGVPVLLDFLKQAGITSLAQSAEHYGLGLTLGDGEVSLFELLQAYTVFANDGRYCPFRFVSEVAEKRPEEECREIAQKEPVDMVRSILTDRYAKLGGFPLYSALDFSDRNVFVKTGTSRNFRDNWAVGFTDRYMIGVWTGNKSGENMKGVSGATWAGEIFRRIVYALEPKEQEQVPRKAQADTQEYLAITNPLEGSFYEKKPEKNPETQKIQARFKTNIPYDQAFWLLDGVKMSSDFINTTSGKHAVEIILMRDGGIIRREKNVFEVR